MDDRILPFDLTTLSFELCLHKHHVASAFFHVREPNCCQFFQMPLSDKNDGHGFSCKQDRQPIFKFNTKKELVFIYRMIPRRMGFIGRIAVSWGS
jgi:hypothetical protein